MKRSMKDYGIYLITMILVTALMMAFHSMMFSPQVKKLAEVAGIMEAMIGMAAGFIVLIVSWLVRYIVMFMMEKRSREFGIYLLIGMNKKQIMKVFMRENTLFGFLAFAIGIFPGLLLEQVLTSVFYHMFGQTYRIRISMEASTFLLTFGLYAGIYLLALWRAKGKMRKMNIRKFLELDKRNEADTKPCRKWKVVFLPVSVLYIAAYAVILYTGNMRLLNGSILAAGLVLMLYLFYEGVAAALVWYIERGGKGVYKKEGLFLLRQSASKIHSMKFTMGTITILFTCAVLGTSCAFMMYDYQKKMMTYQIPFDILLFSQNAEDGFEQEQEEITKRAKVKDMFTYRIYQNKTDTVNRFLRKKLKHMQWEFDAIDRENKRDVEMNVEDGIVETLVSESYFTYDTYMKESDYNHLRSFLGYPEIALKDGEYFIHTKPRLLEYMKSFARRKEIRIGERAYTCKGADTEPFGQNGHNGADYIIVLPDQAAESMTPYYSLLAADIKGEAPKGLYEKLAGLYEKKADAMISKKVERYGSREKAERAEKFVWGTGTDEVISMSDMVLVQTDLQKELNYILTAVAYPLIYIAAVFICTALTVLSVQQLSDAAKYRFRYDVLSKLGLKRREIDRIIRKQLVWYYGVPVLLAVVLSAVIVLFMGSRFVLYTGIDSGTWIYFAGASAVTFLTVGLYLAVTYVGFKRNVNMKMYQTD